MKHVVHERKPTRRFRSGWSGLCATCRQPYAQGEEITLHHGQRHHVSCFGLRRAYYLDPKDEPRPWKEGDKPLSAPVGAQAFNGLVIPTGTDKYDEED